MLKDIKITRKLPLIMISFALISSIATGVIAFLNASHEFELSVQDRLYSLMDSRKAALKTYFETINQDLSFHADSPLIISALTKIKSAYYAIDEDPTAYLRRHYVSANPFAANQKDAFLNAADGSKYSELHSFYHPVFRNLVATRSFHDLFLVSAAGDLIYSVKKESDFATNIYTGPFNNTHLASVFDEISALPQPGLHVFADFSHYRPSNNKPASFIGSPVYDDQGIYIGALVFQMPIEPLNKVMQVTAGMANTGETYVVGRDLYLRSDSRFLKGTSILKTKADTWSVKQALAGKSGVGIIDDYRGVRVFSAYTPIDFMTTRWALIAEIDENEIMQPAYAMSQFLLISGAIIAGIIFITGLLLAFDISSPILTMARAMTNLANNKFDTNISVSDRNDEVGEMASALVTFKQNAIEREKLQQELIYMAHYDMVTGLPSRKYLLKRLDEYLLSAKAENKKLIFMFIDLDNFKSVNDTLGHSIGDQLLKEVAQRLSGCVNSNDLVARLGGDEFVILLRDVKDIQDGYEIAIKIKNIMNTKFDFLHELEIGASTGIALYPDHANNSAALLIEADKAMYVAKKKGTNHFYSSDLLGH